ncbi:MAG: sodium-translocating pyrophosphatase [Clostridia bacterium]|nr:sodium-translocating pyrophosphatase [Clostridia bacterium]
MDLIWIAPIGALIALLFALYNAYKVKRADQGNDKVRELSGIIKQGANAYLKRQYRTVGIFFAAVFAILLVLSFIKPSGMPEGLINGFTPFAFLTGGVFSGLSGFLGMKIATAANGRTATAAQNSLNRGLRVAFSAGSVMGFVVVGLGLLDTSLWFILLKYAFKLSPAELSGAMITFGIGASTMALFARVGGGIFTKAADVGADLVGKVEVGIPEDDPRNPATIADNVGDNVGDVAGMGADLYESYVGSIISAVALAFGAFGIPQDGASTDGGVIFGKMMVPLILAVVGMICSVVGTFFVRCGTSTDQKKLLGALRRGTYIAAGLFAVCAFPIVYFLLGKENLGIYGAVVSGLLAGVLIGYFTEYFTSDTYKPTKKLAKSSETGPATIIISGLSLGMRSVIAPVVIISISIIASFLLSGGNLGEGMNKGLFGIAISAVGMLSTLGITLATDAYGPVADNAGGIAQMAGMEEEVRDRTDALDSLGNTTAATGKGFAIGSAALTSLSLIVAFTQRINMLGGNFQFRIDITNPVTLVGIILGASLPFVFAAMTMDSVGISAQSIIGEVHRQFKEKAGILTGADKPDYAKCVDICTKSSLKQMIMPSVLAVLAPVVIGMLLGPNGITGMLCGATIAGFMLAIFMSNSGGAWDNAKKYIERGNHGGKGSDAHKAGVVGDTVGDPLKDTSGPAINILIKLLSIVSIVFAYIIMNYHLIQL